MRLFVSPSAVVVAVIFAALALTACNSTDGSGSGGVPKSAATSSSSGPVPTTSAPNDGVERITTAELRDALERGTAVVVDVRSPDAYKMGHIRGSINIPEP